MSSFWCPLQLPDRKFILHQKEFFVLLIAKAFFAPPTQSVVVLTKRVAAELQLHSNQGFQYTSQAYFKLTKEYGITPSMSRKGNPYDNALAENFFSILKTECIYRHKPATFA